MKISENSWILDWPYDMLRCYVGPGSWARAHGGHPLLGGDGGDSDGRISWPPPAPIPSRPGIRYPVRAYPSLRYNKASVFKSPTTPQICTSAFLGLVI